MTARWLIVLLSVSACRASAASAQPAMAPEPVPIVRFDDRVAGVSQTSGFEQPARLIVRDSAAWRSAWARVNARFFPQPPLPAVDFSREAVLVAAMGSRPSGGYEIRIDSAARREDTVEVLVRSVTPGEGCVLAAVNAQPVDVAKIPLHGLPVRFREQSVTVSCRR